MSGLGYLWKPGDWRPLGGVSGAEERQLNRGNRKIECGRIDVESFKPELESGADRKEEGDRDRG